MLKKMKQESIVREMGLSPSAAAVFLCHVRNMTVPNGDMVLSNGGLGTVIFSKRLFSNRQRYEE